ncbi:MAG: hypothetical protein ACTSRP_08815 [Candidatus Helarchaeota archaeon]
MIEIIIEATKTKTSPNFLIQDIPGTSGRLDVIIRCILAINSLPTFIKNNIIFTTILNGAPDPPKLFKFYFSKLNFPDDEINAALFFKKLIEKTMKIDITDAENVHNSNKIEINPGIIYIRSDIINYLKKIMIKEFPIIFLHESGNSFRKNIIPYLKLNDYSNLYVIIGDQSGYNSQTYKFLEDNFRKFKLKGNKSYLSSQCIVYLLYELMLIGFF